MILPETILWQGDHSARRQSTLQQHRYAELFEWQAAGSR